MGRKDRMLERLDEQTRFKLKKLIYKFAKRLEHHEKQDPDYLIKNLNAMGIITKLEIKAKDIDARLQLAQDNKDFFSDFLSHCIKEVNTIDKQTPAQVRGHAVKEINKFNKAKDAERKRDERATIANEPTICNPSPPKEL